MSEPKRKSEGWQALMPYMGKLTVYERGILIEAPSGRAPVMPEHLQDTKRGKIGGWSYASRKRLRRMMLTQGPPESWTASSFTLTVPGPLLSAGEVERVKADAGMKLKKTGLLVQWRLEIQERGQIHFHGLIYGPPEGARAPICPRKWASVPNEQVALWFVWKDCLRSLGKCHHVDKIGNTWYALREDLPGASERMCHMRSERSGRLGWVAYLCNALDHTSKHKQGQIADGKGRHWGVVGRCHLRPAAPLSEHDMPAPVRLSFVRRWRKLVRKHIKDPRCPFGWRHGWESKRGIKGSAEWFCNTDPGASVLRLIAWAIENPVSKCPQHWPD